MRSRARVLTLGVALPTLALGLASCSAKSTPPGPPTTAGAGQTSPSTTAAPPASSSTTTSAPTATSAPTTTSTTATSGGGGAKGASITIKNYKFMPHTITVSPGASITVTNDDTVTHTVTDQGVFDTGYISGHSSKTLTAPTKPGTYPYICTIHPFMHGTLVVR